MENATKFLIIAGAILIAIVLISVGMMLVNGAQGTIDESLTQMNQQERQVFNRQFQGYEGAAVNGSNVKSLIEQIVASNNSNVGKSNRQISIAFTLKSAPATITATDLTLYEEGDQITTDGTAAKIKTFSSVASKLKNAINTGSKYEVTMDINPYTGLIYLVNITEEGATKN